MQTHKNKGVPGWIILTIIALVAALALAGTNLLTKGPILEKEEEEKIKARQIVLPIADSFEPIDLAEGQNAKVDEAYVGLKDGAPIGYIAQSTTSGYAADIATIVGMDMQGEVTGISVGGVNFAETAGLGAKAQDKAFTDQFIGKSFPIDIKSDIDSISGATITTRAVVNGVNQAGTFMKDKAGLTEPASDIPSNVTMKGETAVAIVAGFVGDIDVAIEADEDGKISSIKVGEEQFSETEGIGTKVQEESFLDSFSGKTYPLVVGENIDIVSGATISSNAVIQGANDALTALAGGVADDGILIEDNIGRTTVSGFVEDFDVKVHLDSDGAIEKVEVGTESFEETTGIGTRAQEEEFTSLFVGQKAPVDVDALTGATITSQAVIDGVNSIMMKAAGISGEELAVDDDVKVDEIEPKEEPGQTIPEDALVGEVQGFAGMVRVYVTVDEDGAIESLLVGDEDFNETPSIGTRAQEEDFTSLFVGQKAPVEVDVLSGATVTSEAVIKAVNEALGHEEGKKDDTEEEALVGEAQGFVGVVRVYVTVDEDGAIESLLVGDEDFNETPSIGTRAQEEDFTSLFVGQKAPVEVDILSGATVTSEAVIKAVHEALDYDESEEEIKEDVLKDEDVLIGEAMGKSETGVVRVYVTLDEDGAIKSLVVGDEDFDETPGLGTKAQEEDFTSLFIGQKAPIEVEVISGATLTSEAVIKAVNEALGHEEGKKDDTEEETLVGEAQGFVEVVRVYVTLDEDGAIKSLVVGDEDFNETPSIGTRAQEEDFTSLFVGQKAPVEVDILSGATVTSEAVIKAVNEALGHEESKEDDTEEEALVGEAQGFVGVVRVYVTVDEDGAIESLLVGDEDFNETPSIGTRAQEEDFTSLFVGQKAPVEVDVLSGATVTSEAVIKAVHEALDYDESEEEIKEDVLEDEDVLIGEAMGKSETGVVRAYVTLDEDGAIKSLVVGDEDFDETPGLGTKAQEEDFTSLFIGQKAPVEVEVISGATLTSEAVINAVHEALGYEEEEDELEDAKTIVLTQKGASEDITLEIDISDKGHITYMNVEGERFSVKEENKTSELNKDFLDQFITQTAPFIIGENIDGIASATVSSQTVVNLVNRAYILQKTDVEKNDDGTKTTTVVYPGPYEDIVVTLTVDEQDVIKELTISGERFSQGQGEVTTSLNAEFIKQFLGGKGEFSFEKDVDAISSATGSSQAALEAINIAYIALTAK